MELFNNTECSKVQANHPLIALHFYSQFIFISSLFRSIYFHLAFPLLCPFSFARLRVTLWLRVLFGLFYCFSQLYVHFLLPDSVFLSGFRRILDFFPAFLGLMSIFTCSVQCFSLVSRSFWTFFLAFLCFMSIFTCSVRYFPLASRSFWTFSLVFLSFISIWKSIEVSGLRKVRKSLDYDEFGSL